MKLTKSALRRIVVEEIESVRSEYILEADDSAYRATIGQMLRARKNLDDAVVELARERGKQESEVRTKLRAYRGGPNRASYDDSLNNVREGGNIGVEAELVFDLIYPPELDLGEAIENYDLFFDEKVRPLFATHAPKKREERKAFFERLRQKIGTKSLNYIKKNLLFYVKQAKAK